MLPGSAKDGDHGGFSARPRPRNCGGSMFASVCRVAALRSHLPLGLPRPPFCLLGNPAITPSISPTLSGPRGSRSRHAICCQMAPTGGDARGPTTTSYTQRGAPTIVLVSLVTIRGRAISSGWHSVHSLLYANREQVIQQRR